MIRLFNVYYPVRTLVLLIGEALIVGASLLLGAFFELRENTYHVLMGERGAFKIIAITVLVLLCSHWLDLYDTATQAMSSNYIEVTGGRGEYRSIPFRYVWPSELDLMAQMAGLRLHERWDSWTGEPFTSESRQHVSIWRKPAR